METSEAVNTYLGLDGDEQGMVERFLQTYLRIRIGVLFDILLTLKQIIINFI